MKTITIQGTAKTPSIMFNSDKGLLEIKGISMPENSKGFYKPLIKWCKKYVNNPHERTIINIQLEDFNAPSSKVLLICSDLLYCLNLMKTIKESHRDILINWFYKDLNVMGLGEDYEKLTGLQFQFSRKSQNENRNHN
ncbi:hypothetical protein ES705_14970 [subsurface metagenome]